ncbi:MAG: SctK family type III secretion system sorting platform protein [Bilophila sp.]
MHKDFFVELLTGNPQLFQAILSFNGLSETQSCPLPADLGESPCAGEYAAIKALWTNPVVRRRYPQQTAGAILPPFWDFAEESRRLALLPVATLQDLGDIFGAALHGETIARTIVRHDVLELRQGLGAALYDYVLQRGRYQAGSSVRQYFISRNQELSVPEKVRLHGLLALEVCCSTWPDVLRAHAAFHFGDALPFLGAGKISAPKQDENRPPAQSLWLNLKKLLLKEVAPQWAHYFN